MLVIRPAKIEDITAITEIYNEAVLKTTATFDTEPKSVEDRVNWLNNHNEKYPVIVALSDNEIVGWASLTKYSDKLAYAATAENSLYIPEKHQGKGIGKKLLEQLILEGEKAGLHVILARITEGNDISIKLHEKFDFFMVGTMREVGTKFGKLMDVHIMQKIYSR